MLARNYHSSLSSRIPDASHGRHGVELSPFHFKTSFDINTITSTRIANGFHFQARVILPAVKLIKVCSNNTSYMFYV